MLPLHNLKRKLIGANSRLETRIKILKENLICVLSWLSTVILYYLKATDLRKRFNMTNYIALCRSCIL